MIQLLRSIERPAHLTVAALLLKLILSTAEAQDGFDTIDAVVSAIYSGMSGGAGDPRDWEAWSDLFLENATLIPTWNNADGVAAANPVGVAEWIRTSGQSLDDRGVFER